MIDYDEAISRPRFSLAALLVLISVLAIPLGYIAQQRARNLRRSKAYEALSAKGVNFHYQPPNSLSGATNNKLGDLWRFLTCSKPKNLVSTISIGGPGTPGGNTSVTDADLKDLALFPKYSRSMSIAPC